MPHEQCLVVPYLDYQPAVFSSLFVIQKPHGHGLDFIFQLRMGVILVMPRLSILHTSMNSLRKFLETTLQDKLRA